MYFEKVDEYFDLTLEEVNQMDDVTVFEDIDSYEKFGIEVECVWGEHIWCSKIRDHVDFEKFGEDISGEFYWIDNSTAWIEDDKLNTFGTLGDTIFTVYPYENYLTVDIDSLNLDDDEY